MLFDLSSPRRKTAVRIIFGGLAVLFAVGFVGFGIGGESGGGGPVDSLTGRRRLDLRAVRAADRGRGGALEKDPNDSDAPVNVVVQRAQSGNAQLQIDEETEQRRAHGQIARGVRRGDLRLAGLPGHRAQEGQRRRGRQRRQSYRLLGDFEGAIAAQKELAKADPSGPNVSALAQLLVFQPRNRRGRQGARTGACRVERGDEEAPRQAVRAAPKAGGRRPRKSRRSSRIPQPAEARARGPLRRAQPDRSRHSNSLTLATIAAPRAVSSAGRAGDS